MTLFAIFITKDGVTSQMPIAMFKEKDTAERWALGTYGDRWKVKELEITRCDVVERTGLVRG